MLSSEKLRDILHWLIDCAEAGSDTKTPPTGGSEHVEVFEEPGASTLPGEDEEVGESASIDNSNENHGVANPAPGPVPDSTSYPRTTSRTGHAFRPPLRQGTEFAMQEQVEGPAPMLRICYSRDGGVVYICRCEQCRLCFCDICLAHHPYAHPQCPLSWHLLWRFYLFRRSDSLGYPVFGNHPT